MNDELYRLKEEIHACSATECDKMLHLYQQYVALLLNGFQVIWLAAYRGKFGRKLWQTTAMKGWKIIDMQYPAGTNVDVVEAAKKFYKKAKETGAFGPQFMLSVNTSGKSRALLLTDAISRADWIDHWMSKILSKHDVEERMVGAFSLSESAESFIMVDRRPGQKPFGETERRKLFTAIIEFPRLHYWLFLNRGLIEPAKKPLSPREKDVLVQLLQPKNETEIADALNLKKGTVHNYIVDIYKNFGVNSRYELMQLWSGSVPKGKWGAGSQPNINIPNLRA